MNVYEKLMKVQSELKAPKGQFNKFGGYKYRSCEDILEAVKPLLAEVKAVITVADELVMEGTRYYIKAVASFIDVENPTPDIPFAIQNTAFAREEESKKGMDGSQITGTASSYARKYALNGLLCIDDTKDADTNENKNETDAKAATSTKTGKGKQGTTENTEYITEEQYNELVKLVGQAGLTEQKIAAAYKVESLMVLPKTSFDNAVKRLNLTIDAKKKEGK